jgi:hypothetical protein
MRPSRIFIGTAGGGSTFKPYWALNKSESIGTGERIMYPRNNASPERIAIGQVILIADGTVQSESVVITVRGQGGSEGTGGGTTVYGGDNTVYYTPTQAETNFTSFTIIASKASCISSSMTVITGVAPTATENADALLNRDMSEVSDTNARSPLNALRFLRNKWSVAATTLTVTKENDTTAAWTASVTTDASADPIIGNDPA